MASASSIDHHQYYAEIGQQILETRLTIEDEEEEAAAADEVIEAIEDEEEEAAADDVVAFLMVKLEVEYPLISPRRCIFKVPHLLRVVNEKSFIPKAVSVGPYHHKKLEQYEAIEKYKFHYLKQFLNRRRPPTTLEDCTKDCVRMLKSHEKTARECYADDIKLTSDEFVEMMMLDGCFIVELFLRYWKLELRGRQYDPLFDNHFYLGMIEADFLLLENQLPFFVLEALFNFVNASQLQNLWEVSFIDLAKIFFDCNEEDASTLEEPSHLLDLKYKTSIPSQKTNDEDGDVGGGGGESGDGGGSLKTIPTATQLWEAGVKFRAAPPSTHPLDIKFENGTLEIPTIKVMDHTEELFRNMIAYEQCSGKRLYMADYFIAIDDLISSPGDVALLERKGIFINWLGDDQEASNMVNKMGKNVYADSEEFHYKDLYKKLNDYYANPCRKWKAMLKHHYFNTPWSLIAFLAALAVLICTIIQTVNSFKN